MSDKKLLKNCPFCGGEARFSTEDGNWINCKSCGAETDYFEQREEAVNAWNTRVPMQKIVKRLETLQEEYMYPDDDDYIVGQYDGVREALTVVLEEVTE